MGDLDLNIENIYYALSFVNNSKERLSELSSVLNSININGVELSTAGLLDSSKLIVNEIVNGSFEDVGNRLEKTKNIIVDNDVEALLYFAFLDGEFDDDFGNFSQDKFDEYVEKKQQELYEEAVKKAEEEYYEKLRKDSNFRYETALKAILSENGFESLEEIDSQRDKLLSTIKELNRRKNDILFSDAQVTLNFLNVVNGKYMGICSSFGGIANSETLAYKYVDKYGIEYLSWTLNGVPKDYRDRVESLSYTDMCGGSVLYNEIKSGFEGNWFFTNPFNSEYKALSKQIQEQISIESVELEEINNSLTLDREELAKLDSTRQSIVESATYISEDVWKYTLNEDFDEKSSDIVIDEISSVLNNLKNTGIPVNFSSDSLPLFNQNHLYLNNREEEMQVVYSMIAGKEDFYFGNGEVSYINSSGQQVYLKTNDDMLSNMSLWASEMSDDQKAIFYYNWNTGGYEAAYDFLDGISDELNSEYVLNRSEEDQKYADENPGLASVTSVLLGPFEGLKSFEYSVTQLINKDKMYSSQLYSHGDTMRAQVSTNIANKPDDKYAGAKSFMYNVSMSIADNMYSIALTGGNSIASGMILGAGGFDNNMNDALSRGLSDEKAFMYSGSMALVEAATEAVSIDNLLNLKPLSNSAIKRVGDFIGASDEAITSTLKATDDVFDKLKFDKLEKINKLSDEIFNKVVLNLDDITDPKYRNLVYKGTNLLYGTVKQGSGEGMEELASSIMGEWVDKIFAGENTAFNLSVENYINNGYTEAEAIAMTQQQQIGEFAMSYLSGLTSGSVSGGGKLAGSMAISDVSSYVGNMVDKYKNPNYDVVKATINENIRKRNFEGAIDFIMNQDGKSVDERAVYASSLINVLSLKDNRMISENMQQKLTDMVQKHVETTTNDGDIKSENSTDTVNEDLSMSNVESVQGFQIGLDAFGGFFKAKIDSGFITEQQVEVMLNRINNRGYVSESTGKYFSSLFESGEYDVYVKTIHSSDVESIMSEGVRCLGNSTSGYGGVPTNVNDVDLDNTITKVDGVYDLFAIVKYANGISQGMNPIDGTLIIKAPKGTDASDMLYFSETSGTYCIKPEYIDCFSGVDNNGVVSEPMFNEIGTEEVLILDKNPFQMNSSDIEIAEYELKDGENKNAFSVENIVDRLNQNISSFPFNMSVDASGYRGTCVVNNENFYVFNAKKDYNEYNGKISGYDFFNWLVDSDGQYVGYVTAAGFSERMLKETEITYEISEKYQGKGFATELLKFMVNDIFENGFVNGIEYSNFKGTVTGISDVKKINLAIADWNIASQRVAEKNGFIADGYGGYVLDINSYHNKQNIINFIEKYSNIGANIDIKTLQQDIIQSGVSLEDAFSIESINSRFQGENFTEIFSGMGVEDILKLIFDERNYSFVKNNVPFTNFYVNLVNSSQSLEQAISILEKFDTKLLGSVIDDLGLNYSLNDIVANTDNKKFLRNIIRNVTRSDALSLFKDMSYENIQYVITSLSLFNAKYDFYSKICNELGLDENKESLLAFIFGNANSSTFDYNNVELTRLLNLKYSKIDLYNEENIEILKKDILDSGLSLTYFMELESIPKVGLGSVICSNLFESMSKEELLTFLGNYDNFSWINFVVRHQNIDNLIYVLDQCGNEHYDSNFIRVMVNDILISLSSEQVALLFSNSQFKALDSGYRSEIVKSLVNKKGIDVLVSAIESDVVDFSFLTSSDLSLNSNNAMTMQYLLNILSDEIQLAYIIDGVEMGYNYDANYTNKEILFGIVKLFAECRTRNYNLKFSNEIVSDFYRLYKSLYTSNTREDIVRFIDTYTLDKSKISIVSDSQFYGHSDGKVGADQHSIVDAFSPSKLATSEGIKLKKLLVNQMKQAFPGMSTKFAIEFLKKTDIGVSDGGTGGICNYADVCNAIFEYYDKKGKEEFERTFGFPMYLDGRLNDAQLLLDMFINIAGKEMLVKNGKIFGDRYNLNGKMSDYVNLATSSHGISYVYRGDYISDYLKSKGIMGENDLFVQKGLFISKRSNFSGDNYISSNTLNVSSEFVANDILIKIHSALKNGEHLSISSLKGLKMELLSGKVYDLDGAHIMSIYGIDNNGNILVDSWGMNFKINLKQALDDGVKFDIGSIDLNAIGKINTSNYPNDKIQDRTNRNELNSYDIDKTNGVSSEIDSVGTFSDDGISEVYSDVLQMHDKILQETDFSRLGLLEKQEVADFFGKDVAGISSEEYANFRNIVSISKIFFKNVPEKYTITREFLYGSNNKIWNNQEFINKVSKHLGDKDNLVKAIEEYANGDIGKIREIGFYNLVNAINEFAIKYVYENGIIVPDGKFAIEMLKVEIPKMYDGAKTDIGKVLDDKIKSAKKNNLKIEADLVKIINNLGVRLANQSIRDDNGFIKYSVKSDKRAIEKMYIDWYKDLSNLGYKISSYKVINGNLHLVDGDGKNYVLNSDGNILDIENNTSVLDQNGNVVRLDFANYIPNDLLRFTILSDADSYVDTVGRSIKMLEDLGYKIEKAKFKWPNTDKVYQGVNLTVSKDGQVFELQVHTDDSFYAKDDGTHLFYEISRNDAFRIGDGKSSIQKVADYAQYLVQGQVNVPIDVKVLTLVQENINNLIEQGKPIGDYLLSQLDINSTIGKVNRLLVEKGPQEIYNYIKENSTTLNQFYQSVVIQNFMNNYFDDNVRGFTFNIINNLSREHITTDLIEMIQSLDDEQFKDFVRINENSILYENDEIFNRAVNTGINFISGLDSNIQLKLINNDTYMNGIKNNIYNCVRVLSVISPENIDAFINKIELSSKSLSDKLYFVMESSQYVDSQMQKRIIEMCGLLNSIELFDYYKLKRFVEKIKDEDYLYQIFSNDQFYKKITSKKIAYGIPKNKDIYSLISFLSPSYQIKFIETYGNDFMKDMTFSELNELLKNCSKETIVYLYNEFPNLKNQLLDSNTYFEIYLKTLDESFFEKFKESMGTYFSSDIREKLVINNLLSKFTNDELFQIYSTSSLSEVLKYYSLTDDVKYKAFFNDLIDDIIDNSKNISSTVLRDNFDYFTLSQVDKIISKIDNYGRSELIKIIDKLNDKQVDAVLSMMDIKSLVSNIENDKVYDYLLSKVKSDASLFKDVADIWFIFLNDIEIERLHTIIENIRMEDMVKFISEYSLKNEDFRKQMQDLILSKPELLLNVSSSQLNIFLNTFSLENRLSLYNNMSPKTLVSVYNNDLIDNEKNIIKTLILNNFDLLEVIDKSFIIKKMSDNEQIEFINKLSESDYSSWNFKDLLTSIKSEEGKNILFRKWFSDDSSIKLKSDDISSILSVMDDSTFNQFISICSDEILVKCYSTLSNENIQSQLMHRFNSNLDLFACEDGALAFSKLSLENQQYVINKVREQFVSNFQNTSLENIIDLSYVDSIQLTKLNYAKSLGYLTSDKIELLSNMFKKNRHVFKTLNIHLLNPNVADIGDMFIEKMSKYEIESQMVVDLFKTNFESFKVFKNVAKNLVSNDSFGIFNQKVGLLLNYFKYSYNYKDIDFSKFNDNMYNEFFNYIINNSYLFGSEFDISDKIKFTSFDENYSVNYNKFLDELFNNATTLEEKKNVLLTKLFGLSMQETKIVLTSYYDGLVDYIDNDNLVFEYLSNMKAIYEIDNIDILDDLYMERMGSNIDILYIINEVKKIYAKSYIEKLSATRDKVNDLMSRNTLVVSKDDFSFDGFNDSAIVEYNGKMVPIVSLIDGFNLIVNSTGAFGEMGLINNNYSDSWNLSERTRNHGICCSYIGNSQLGTADVEGNGVLFGFYGFSENSISLMAPFDIYSRNDDIATSSGKQSVFVMADEITSKTRNVYNEFVIERTEWRTDVSSKYSGIQPDYVVVFADWDSKLKENALKAASDFEPPLQVIYIDKVNAAKNESIKIDNLLKQFDSEPGNLELLKKAIDLHESNRTGFGHSQNVLNVDEYFSTKKILAALECFVKKWDMLYRVNSDNVAIKEKLITRFSELCDILKDEQNKFDFGQFHLHSKTQLDMKVDGIVAYLEKYISDVKEAM